jgi:hypothetical protein
MIIFVAIGCHPSDRTSFRAVHRGPAAAPKGRGDRADDDQRVV